MVDGSSDGTDVAALRAEVQRLEELSAQLQAALDSRVVIEQAKGAVAVRCGVTPDVAFEMICGLARGQRRRLQDVCAEVIENEGRLDGMPRSNGRVPVGLRS